MLRSLAKKVLPRSVAQRMSFQRNARPAYARALHEPLDEHAVLLESRHGEAFEGNMFYLAREVLENPAYGEFRVVVPAQRGYDERVRREAAALGGDVRVRVVERNSDEYFHELATCKYVMTDTSLGYSFCKRADQVYLNTWHGTPLKTLGRFVPDEAHAMGNVQRCLLGADVLTVPNEHTGNALFDAYMLDGLQMGRTVLCGYPRNGALLDEGVRAAVRERFGLGEKRVYAYLPTYRGLNHALEDGSAGYVRTCVQELARGLHGGEELYVNLHPFMAAELDLDALEGASAFPQGVASYDFLAACDGLVTDYSSVMFDFACTGRPVALLTGDAESYLASRGMCLDLDGLGFPRSADAAGTLEALRAGAGGGLARVRERFCRHDGADAPARLLGCVIGGEEPPVFARSREQGRRNVLVHVEGLRPQQVREALERWFSDPGLASNRYVVTFRRDWPHARELVGMLDGGLDYLASVGSAVVEEELVGEYWAFLRGRLRDADGFGERMRGVLEREWLRRYGSSRFDGAVALGTYDHETCALFALLGKDATLVTAGEPSAAEQALFRNAGAYVERRPEWLAQMLA